MGNNSSKNYFIGPINYLEEIKQFDPVPRVPPIKNIHRAINLVRDDGEFNTHTVGPDYKRNSSRSSISSLD